MNLARKVSDNFAIGLSLICAIHCVITPWLLLIVPSLSALNLDNEAFHYWMVIAVTPLSLYALGMGCKQHKDVCTVVLGAMGLVMLLGAIVLGEDRIGELAEKVVTVIGAGLIAAGHYKNIHLCRKLNCS